ncbi:hypothetical protein BGP75_10405 [Motiliproteus sp. MSK22-1]|nr:hypothetical protein BGP75_10405 [Motiliproteus sp. MSK22-1]
MNTQIDHLVIGAETLAQGVSYVRKSLGVDIPAGGVHVKMGTHNHLMQLGDDTFLEVISLNPELESPERPRWYGLDDPFVRQQLRLQPALLTWVVNTQDISALMRQANISFGTVESVSRNNLDWYFGVPDDGRLLAGGMLPYAMQWLTEMHPSNQMADLGCRLQGLEIYHPHPAWLLSVLESIGAEKLIGVHALASDQVPYLAAKISTPNGIKTLYSLENMLRNSV